MENTRKQLACDMRVNGCTYAEIGKQFNVSKQRAHQIINSHKKGYFFYLNSCVYINLKMWLETNKWTSKKLASQLNCSLSTVRQKLKGKREFKVSELLILSDITGLTIETILMRSDGQ